MQSPNELLPEDSRAFLRHAYNQFYHDFSNVDLKDTNFYWHLTFSSALKSFRLAALRYGMNHRILYTRESTLTWCRKRRKRRGCASPTWWR